jgi:hypothetical protein
MPSADALVAAYEALHDKAPVSPYLVMACAMRKLGEPEEEVYEHLLGVAQGRCEDAGVVFEALYGSGEVLRPSEPL